MADSRRLRVLDAAEDLAATVCAAVAHVEVRRAPGVRGRLVRAAAAVAANIADAAKPGPEATFSEQLQRSLSSATEAGRHLRVLRRTGALDPLSVARCEAKRTVVCTMLVGLIRRIEQEAASRNGTDHRSSGG